MNTIPQFVLMLGWLGGWLVFLVLAVMVANMMRLHRQYLVKAKEHRELLEEKLEGSRTAIKRLQEKLDMQNHMMAAMAKELLNRGGTPPDGDDGEAWKRG